MIFEPTPVAGAFVVRPEPIRDARGSFARLWCGEEFTRRGLAGQVAQMNAGFSPRAGTLRGLHYQEAPHREAKTVWCTRGAAFDVVVDLRRDSPSYQTWHGVVLEAGSGQMLYVPEACAHGYLTLVNDTEVLYTASTGYAPRSARGVRFDDPALGIVWPRAVELLSDQDAAWPRL